MKLTSNRMRIGKVCEYAATSTLSKMLVLGLALALVNEGANAEWRFVSIKKTGNVYYDPAITYRFGDTVQTVTLTNLTAEELGTRSIVSDIEFDCRKRTATVMSVIRYAGKNGGGRVIDFATYIENDDWPKNRPTKSKLFYQVCSNYKSLKDNK